MLREMAGCCFHVLQGERWLFLFDEGRQPLGIEHPYPAMRTGTHCFHEPAREKDDRFCRKGSAGPLFQHFLNPSGVRNDLLDGIPAWDPAIDSHLVAIKCNLGIPSIGFAIRFRLNDEEPLGRNHDMVYVEAIRNAGVIAVLFAQVPPSIFR